MRTFGRFLKELFSSWWGIAWVALSVISTILSYAFTFSSHLKVYWWIPPGVSLIAWFLAPFDLYRRKQQEIKRLRAKVETKGKRLAELVIHPASRSKYYVEVEPTNRSRVRGVYVLLQLTVENKGETNSVVREFGLQLQDTGKNYSHLQPDPRSQIQASTTLFAGLGNDYIVDRQNNLVVQAGNVRTGSLPFFLNDSSQINRSKSRCILTLTLTDTAGIQAQADFTVTNAEG
jgi:hypothetical protein